MTKRYFLADIVRSSSGFGMYDLQSEGEYFDSLKSIKESFSIGLGSIIEIIDLGKNGKKTVSALARWKKYFGVDLDILGNIRNEPPKVWAIIYHNPLPLDGSDLYRFHYVGIR